jgi:hypothetical protein
MRTLNKITECKECNFSIEEKGGVNDWLKPEKETELRIYSAKSLKAESLIIIERLLIFFLLSDLRAFDTTSI